MAVKRKSKTFIIILAVMALMVAAAIFIGRRVLADRPASTVNVSLPLIVTPLTDSVTGKEYNVQTIFTVTLNTSARSEFTDAELLEEMSSIMQEMSMSRLLQKGRVDYLNTRATELLKERLAGGEVNVLDTQVLVVDFATDDRVTLNDPKNQSNKVMEGLFQNIR